MKIFEIIEEQAIIGFSGKLNCVAKKNGASVGTIFLLDGQICNCSFDQLPSLKAFINLYIYMKENTDIQIILEPEVIHIDLKKIDIPLENLKKVCLHSWEKYLETKGERPPENIRLKINEHVFDSNIELNASEYKLLCIISDNSLVKDIYRECSLLDYEITQNLVQLRKKDILKVVQTK